MCVLSPVSVGLPVARLPVDRWAVKSRSIATGAEGGLEPTTSRTALKKLAADLYTNTGFARVLSRSPPSRRRLVGWRGAMRRGVTAYAHLRDQCPSPTLHSASSKDVRYALKSTCLLTA